MPYLILVLCAVVCTFFLARLLAAKTRFVDKAIPGLTAFVSHTLDCKRG